MRELRHAYYEICATLNLTKYASSLGVQVPASVNDLMGTAYTAYEKARTYYEGGKYVEVLAYAHLSIEACHSARQVLEFALGEAGIVPPPP